MLAKELLESCPFYDKKRQRIVTNWRCTWDRVFIWQPLAQPQIGSILLPDTVRAWHKPQLGVIVSVGKGWYDEKKFYPMFLQPGWVVIFDLRTPWHTDMKNMAGERHELRYMGEMDVRAIVDPEQDIDIIGDLICKGNFIKRAVKLGGMG